MAKQAAICNKGRKIREYPLASGAAFVEGAAVVVTAGALDECGADPASILGFALHDAGADPDPTHCLTALAYPESTFFLEGDRAPLVTDIGVSYGVAKDTDGQWFVDTTDTIATRVIVEDVDLTRSFFEVKILAANRQLA